MIAVLALPTIILAWRATRHLTLVLNGFRIPDDVTGVPPWALWAQAILVWIWWTSLAASLSAYSRATSATMATVKRRLARLPGGVM